MAAPLVLAPLYFVLSFLGPGLLLVRRAEGWSAAEKATASIVLSLAGIYLASFLVFALGLGSWAHLAILVLCAFLTFAVAPDLRRLFGPGEARSLFVWLALLALGAVSLEALIRNYSGGGWYWDWLEHYERSRFFLGSRDYGATFREYALPARPPLMNVIAAHFLAIAGARFRVYQVVSCLLGVLAFPPLLLLARRFALREDRPAPAGLVAALLMLNPMFVENATYPWTKPLTVFFVLTGLAFYLTGAARGEFPRLLLAFTALSAGIATHYSAAPYALFLAGHYLVFVRPRSPAGWRQTAAIAAAACLVLGSWIAWSVAIYGLGETVAATPTVRDAAGFSATGNLVKVGGNIARTLLPHALRFEAGFSPGGLRDAFFRLYQSNLPFALGILGPLALLAALRAGRGPGPRPAGLLGRRFWVGFVLWNVLVGIAVHGGEDRVGLAQVSLQPLVMLGIACIAARFADLPRALRVLAAAGLLFDLVFGILLQAWLESVPFDGSGGPFAPAHADLSLGSTLGNWTLKQDYGILFLGDGLEAWAWMAACLAAVVLAAGITALLRALRGAPLQPRR